MTWRSPLVLLTLLASFSSTACSSCTPGFRECADVDPARLAALPAWLAETGLFVAGSPETLADGVLPFAPRFPLWTDGAEKRRFIRLPPGTQIDTSDPNAWVFPEGTKIWKEFRRDDERVETRLLFKHGPGIAAWTPVAYLWEGDDAWAIPEGRQDALGTPHDVPSASDCTGCHGGSPSGVLGLSAVQLPARGSSGLAGLAEFQAAGLIDESVAAFEIPGDSTTRAALGYLHANCGHCHDARRLKREGPRCFDPESSIDFTLRVGELDAPEATATYQTTLGGVVLPGDPDGSEVMIRLRSRDVWWGMPALGTETVDAEGVQTLESWIRRL